MAGQSQKNILFIAVDDLRTSLGCYNDPLAITPNIDNLAQKGFLFEKAYCQQAVSGPSRASLLTGYRPEQIGVTDLSSHFREKCSDIVTLPEYFKNNGYQSVCIGKIYHGSPKTQDPQSWSEAAIHNLSIKKEEYVLPENRHGNKSVAVELSDAPDTDYEDGRITKDALTRLQEFRHSDKPFFLAVGYKKPHLPFNAPKRFRDMHAPGFRNITSFAEGKKYRNIPEIAMHNSQELRGYTDIPDAGDLSESQTRELLTAYYACVSFVDQQIGLLLEELKKTGQDQNTVIVLFGDNGFHLGEQDLWCKSTNFEIACKVPLIIYDPSHESTAASIPAIVELLDVYPTLLDLCGFDFKHLPGQSLLPVIKGQDKGKDMAFSQFARPYNAVHSAKNQTHMGYTVRVENWRYTAWYDLSTDRIIATELYYLPGNTLEEVNLSGESEYASIGNNLRKKIEEYKHTKK